MESCGIVRIFDSHGQNLFVLFKNDLVQCQFLIYTNLVNIIIKNICTTEIHYYKNNLDIINKLFQEVFS